MERVRFITHEGKQVLEVDCTDCSAKEMLKVVNEVMRRATAEPRESVLVLTNFAGAKFDKDTMTRLKEVAVYDRPFVKRSAFYGADNLPKVYFEALKAFSQRDFRQFNTRDEALAFLVQD